MRLPADPEQPVKTIGFRLMALLLFVTPTYGNGGECAFDSKGLGQLKIGDPESKVRDIFASGYGITEHSGGIAQRRVEVRKSSSNGKLYSFSLSNDDRVMFIDIFGACKNADGIGIGSRLGDARKRYGKAKLEPTDAGYFVIFDRIPTIGFLLENKDLPKKLRNLPDDSTSTKSERSILATSNARFLQIRIYPE
jgi:hypothetical protein